MKKNITWFALILLPTITMMLFSCQKDLGAPISNTSEEATVSSSHGPVTRAFRDSFEVWLKFKPNISGGWNPANPNSLVWWPGYGDGNVSHMGNASIHFNGYTVRQPSGGVYIYSAPVNMFFATELQDYNVPANVAAVILDDKGNSLWCMNDPNGVPSSTVSPTMITFSGKMYITGGTGKFENATGETTLTGYFDPSPLQTNPNALLAGALWNYGWIAY